MFKQIAASKMDPNHFLMLVLLRFELFDYFNGSCSSKDQVSTKLLTTQKKKKCCATKCSTYVMQHHFQDELIQWNRLTEEMLYLLIVITGTLSHSANHGKIVSWI